MCEDLCVDVCEDLCEDLRGCVCVARTDGQGTPEPGYLEQGCSPNPGFSTPPRPPPFPLSPSIHLPPWPFALVSSSAPSLENEARRVPLKCRAPQTCQPLRGLWPDVPPPAPLSVYFSCNFLPFPLFSSFWW